MYDIRADVWSLGITLVELASGKYPYGEFNSEFAAMSAIINSEPPCLDGDQFSENFKSFTNKCLKKNYKDRPKYKDLFRHPFIIEYMNKNVDAKPWFDSCLNYNNTTNNTSSI
jgi:serine/threonine protein kinase